RPCRVGCDGEVVKGQDLYPQ
ncbi:hypothetical protein L195_g064674, partial [Trifolium pratense]